MSEPVAKAILPCNYGIVDKADRWTLVGLFNALHFPGLPARGDSFFLFVRLVDIPKKGIFSIALEAPNGLVVWTSGPIPYENPTEYRTFEHLFPIPSTLWTEFGPHRLVFYVGTDRVAETTVLVEKRISEQVEA